MILRKTKYLFPDTLNEKNCEFYFESHYNPLLKKIFFNRNNGDNYSMYNTIGNINLEERSCNNNLIITTYSYETQKYSLWIAHKNGTNLKRVREFSEEQLYLIDVKNQMVRFLRQIGSKIEMEDFAY
jgi:hypothetical protein